MTQTAQESAKPGPAIGDGEEDKYLTFLIGEECYGMEIGVVTEIIGMQRITPIPDCAHYVKGVINLRGKIIPVMDVRLRFGMAQREYDERTCIIVIEVGGEIVGLVVDRVSEVLDIPAGQVELLGHISDRETSPFIRAMGKVGDEVKILLDAKKIIGGLRA